MSTLVAALNGERLARIDSSSQDNITVRDTDAPVRWIGNRLQSGRWNDILSIFFSEINLAFLNDWVSWACWRFFWKSIQTWESHSLSRRSQVGSQVDLLEGKSIHTLVFLVYKRVYRSILPPSGDRELIWLVLIRSIPDHILRTTSWNLINSKLSHPSRRNRWAISRLWCTSSPRYSLKLRRRQHILIALNLQWRPVRIISVPCVRLRASANESVLSKAFLVDSKFCFIYCFAFRGGYYWASDFLRSKLSKSLCASNARDHWVLVVVVLLIRFQIVFVKPLFDCSHITVALHCLTTLDLLIKLLLVHNLCPIFGHLFPRIELSV